MATLREALAIAAAYHEAGRLELAEEVCRRILVAEPAMPDALHRLGLVVQRRGDCAAAVDYIGRAAAIDPANAAYRNSLGEAYREWGRLDEAAACYQAALERNAALAEAHSNWGVVLESQGNLDEAAARFRQALAIKADLPEAHSNLGCVLVRQGRIDEAIACHQRALQLAPGFAYAQNNLGEAYRMIGKLDAAAECFRRAIEGMPDAAEVHSNLGAVLHRQGKLDEAVACYCRAIALKPGWAEAHANLGNARKDQGRLDEALESYRRALAIDPRFAAAHSDLLYTMHLSPRYDAGTIYAEHRRWNQMHALPLAASIRAHANDRTPERRLRIGYVSPDLGGNPIGRFLLPLLEAHDHGRFEIFCYSSAPVSDAMTDRCRDQADAWRDVLPLSDEQLAEAVRADRIDILVDLSMHAASSRLLAFARKPAPVQVTYLAYCGTTGLDAIDYRLTDRYLDPPNEEQRIYSEESICLPDTYWCYQPLAAAPPVNRLPALAAGRVTFGCLNNFCKVTEPAFAVWPRLLRAVPESRLLLHAYAGSHRDRLCDALAREGVDPERLLFVDFLPTREYFQAYQRIDVGLDPFPYGGGTTTCDALWMGVPVVSLAGRTAVGRGGLSILSNLGLRDLVASDADQYVRIAADLAGDVGRLAELRSTLRQCMQQSPLMDAPRFARNVEAAYRTMWRRWCETPGTSAGAQQ
jgi:predicted O-linked N-acetylglucosamine transferase (SPINDLY family)